MQTNFSPSQLADPDTASSEAVIRKCVHCGFCTATCPTYVLLGDELDSPRGRIYLIKDMLENDRVPTPEVVKHVDRCLSCLACMTTCPSGVNYMHLVDHARSHIEETYRRPLRDRLLRDVLRFVMPHPRRFRAALRLSALVRPLRNLLPRSKAFAPLRAMLALVPRRIASAQPLQDSRVEAGRGRVVLLQGCVESTLRPDFRAATIRLLNRMCFDVVFARGEGCCGALVHHMGRTAESLDAARRNVDAWWQEAAAGNLKAILVTASGCGTTIKDYGYMLRDDPEYSERAAAVSALAKDVSEFVLEAGLPPGRPMGLSVGYQAPCSLQHGQKIVAAPAMLLEQAGFSVEIPDEAHLCCGSAGTYNIVQPELAGRLGDRKAVNLERLGVDIIATGNVGCALQIQQRTPTPVVHVVELLDWATGGPVPHQLEQAGSSAS